MPFERPSIRELRNRAAADLDAELQGTDATLRRSNTRVLAGVHSGACHGLHGHLGYIADQIMEDSAEGEFLLRRAAIRGITPEPATYASGRATATGIDGAVIEAGKIWQRSDGATYVTNEDATIVDGTATVLVTAEAAGVDGNCEDGITTLSLIETIDGVNGDAVVVSIIGGSDDEGEEDLRARLLSRIRQPPAGGNKHDYVRWAEEIVGVKKAWYVPMGQGPGTSDVVIIADEDIMGTVVPSADLLAAVREHIVDICPGDVKFLRVLAPTFVPLNLTLRITPDSTAIREAVTDEVAALLARERAAGGWTLRLSRLNEAISSAPGEENHETVSPQTDIGYGTYELPVMGVITWQ